MAAHYCLVMIVPPDATDAPKPRRYDRAAPYNYTREHVATKLINLLVREPAVSAVKATHMLRVPKDVVVQAINMLEHDGIIVAKYKKRYRTFYSLWRNT